MAPSPASRPLTIPPLHQPPPANHVVVLECFKPLQFLLSYDDAPMLHLLTSIHTWLTSHRIWQMKDNLDSTAADDAKVLLQNGMLVMRWCHDLYKKVSVVHASSLR